MLRDCESFCFSYKASDYWTYNRYYTPSGYNSNSITTGGGTNDPCFVFACDANQSANICRRIVPGGPFSALGHSLRMLLGTSLFTINAVDIVNGLNHCSVTFNGNSGVLQVYGPGGLLLTTAPGQFPINAFFWVELLFTIGSGTSGSVQISLPSTTINLTGVNTQYGSRALVDTTSYTANNGSSNFMQHKVWWDTTGSFNNSFLGDRRVFGVLPTANGDITQLTPVGLSTNYENAGQGAPNSANYNASATVGYGDLYKGATPSGITAVAGVMVSLLAEKDDSGTRSAASWLKSGGTLASGATVPLASSYTTQSDIWETDPSTGVAFTPAALSAPLQFGAKVAA